MMLAANLKFHERPLVDSALEEEVLGLLSQSEKQLPCRLLYDEVGSELFERICETEEYYPTRTEVALLRKYGTEMADRIGSPSFILEYGAGNTQKARLLLQQMVPPVTYMPVDISGEHLKKSVEQLAQNLPWVKVEAVCADFLAPSLPSEAKQDGLRGVLFFPGSTIGNFEPNDAVEFLRSSAQKLGDRAAVLIGVDLKKDPARINAAYNDAAGYTERFIKNILVRLNRETSARFNLDAFTYQSSYNAERGCIETFLVSKERQLVPIAGTVITFQRGEKLHIENSYKYSVNEFGLLAERAGLKTTRTWMDDEKLFSIHLLERT